MLLMRLCLFSCRHPVPTPVRMCSKFSAMAVISSCSGYSSWCSVPGARLAEPGEFTKRAFLNGRIDLLQAEAVIELIRGKTEAALALAQHQREGILSKRIAAVKEGIVTSLAFIEAYLDFPEEDIDIPAFREIETAVRTSLSLIEELLGGFQQGKVLREGVSVLIVGKPNVGKSSLLNTLLKEKRAIVTSVPGTTRDIIEEVVNIKGLPVNLLDTAGIRDSEDEIEQEGMKLTMEKIPLADLILFVVDSSKPFENEDTSNSEAILGRRVHWSSLINQISLKPFDFLRKSNLNRWSGYPRVTAGALRNCVRQSFPDSFVGSLWMDVILPPFLRHVTVMPSIGRKKACCLFWKVLLPECPWKLFPWNCVMH